MMHGVSLKTPRVLDAFSSKLGARQGSPVKVLLQIIMANLNSNSDISSTGRRHSRRAGNTFGLASSMVQGAGSGSGLCGKYNKHLTKNQKTNYKI